MSCAGAGSAGAQSIQEVTPTVVEQAKDSEGDSQLSPTIVEVNKEMSPDQAISAVEGFPAQLQAGVPSQHYRMLPCSPAAALALQDNDAAVQQCKL